MRKPSIPDFCQSYVHTYLDEHGRVQCVTRSLHRREAVSEDVTNDEHVFQYLLLSDGRFVASGDRRPLVSCLCCRRGRRAGWLRAEEVPTLGLCLEESAVRCQEPGCGAWCCPRHAHGSAEAGWRCRDCSEHSPLLEALFSIFFE